MNEFQADDSKIIVKIFNADKVTKTTTAGGIITSHMLKETMDYCQIGECVSVGEKINYIKKGERVLFTWMVEDAEETLIDKDPDGDYRYVTEKQIYGTIKINKSGYWHIIPKKNYVMCEPIGSEFEHTLRGIFQIPVAAINPFDNAVKKIGIKVGDWIICLQYAAVQISVKRQWYWFIHISDILVINRGEHKVRINRKRVSQNIRLASRKETVELN